MIYYKKGNCAFSHFNHCIVVSARWSGGSFLETADPLGLLHTGVYRVHRTV